MTRLNACAVVVSLVLVSGFAAWVGAQGPAAAGAAVEDWPAQNGNGTFVPPRVGRPLIDKAGDAELDWLNPLNNGVGKTNARGYLECIGRGAETAFYGGSTGLVVADGKVFVTFYEPSGDVVAERDSIKHRYYSAQDMAKLPDSVFRIAADDVTVAIDAESGKTLWTAREKDRAFNTLSDKRGHFGVAGAVGGGMYYAFGMLGRVYAYEATTGVKKWEYVLAGPNARLEALKKQCLEKKSLLAVTDKSLGISYHRGGIVVADDVVVVPDLAGGLVGLEAGTGKELWQARGVLYASAMPTLWPHDGKSYLLVAGGAYASRHTKGTVRLLDVRTGKPLWEQAAGGNIATLCASRTHVMLDPADVPAGEPLPKGRVIMACYEISLAGLKQVWRFENKPENYYEITPDAGMRRRMILVDDTLYMKLGDKEVQRLASFEVKTGRLLHEGKAPSGGGVGPPYVAEDRMFWHLDSAHSAGRAGFGVYRLLPGGKFESMGTMMFTEFGVYHATEYEIPNETPYYKGRFFLRAFPGVAAIDVTRHEEGAGAWLTLHGGYAGAGMPLRVRLRCDESGRVRDGRVFCPDNTDLGVPITKAQPSGNARQPVRMLEGLAITAEGLKGRLGLDVAMFGWTCVIDLKREGDKLVGRWTRSIAGLDKTIETRGAITGTGGHRWRVYPTPWLKEQPMTRYGALPEGQQRLVLSLEGAIPDLAQGDSKGATVLLDFAGARWVSGAAAAFSFNQAWHEIDGSGLTLKDGKLSGELIVIVNADPWKSPTRSAGAALAGRVSLDATVADGEPSKVAGTFTATWGESLERTGKAEFERREAGGAER